MRERRGWLRDGRASRLAYKGPVFRDGACAESRNQPGACPSACLPAWWYRLHGVAGGQLYNNVPLVLPLVLPARTAGDQLYNDGVWQTPTLKAWGAEEDL